MSTSLFRAACIGVTGLLASALTANAQCSANTTVMNTVTINGGSVDFIDAAPLSDGAMFTFHADDVVGVTAFVFSNNDFVDFSGWYEDSNGTATMTNADGDICTVACASNGSVLITVAGPTFESESWVLDQYLQRAMPGDKCACLGTTTQVVKCDQTHCDSTAKCSKNGYCQAGTTPVDMPAGEPQ